MSCSCRDSHNFEYFRRRGYVSALVCLSIFSVVHGFSLWDFSPRYNYGLNTSVVVCYDQLSLLSCYTSTVNLTDVIMLVELTLETDLLQ